MAISYLRLNRGGLRSLKAKCVCAGVFYPPTPPLQIIFCFIQLDIYIGSLTFGNVSWLPILKTCTYVCIFTNFLSSFWLKYLQMLMQILSGHIQPEMYRMKVSAMQRVGFTVSKWTFERCTAVLFALTLCFYPDRARTSFLWTTKKPKTTKLYASWIKKKKKVKERL